METHRNALRNVSSHVLIACLTRLAATQLHMVHCVSIKGNPAPTGWLKLHRKWDLKRGRDRRRGEQGSGGQYVIQTDMLHIIRCVCMCVCVCSCESLLFCTLQCTGLKGAGSEVICERDLRLVAGLCLSCGFWNLLFLRSTTKPLLYEAHRPAGLCAVHFESSPPCYMVQLHTLYKSPSPPSLSLHLSPLSLSHYFPPSMSLYCSCSLTLSVSLAAYLSLPLAPSICLLIINVFSVSE
jgi:hypothetical protein